MVKSSILIGTAAAMWWPGNQQQQLAQTPTNAGKTVWLPWGAWSSCRGVCGSGVSNRIRRCLNGIGGVDCDGNTLDSRSCDNPIDDRCSYWSGWGQWIGWQCDSSSQLIRKKTRTCYGRDQDQCVGSTEIVETKNAPIAQTCEMTNNDACCSFDNPSCKQEICFIQGQCQPKVETGRKDIALPCCAEYGDWSCWADKQAKCTAFITHRTRSNKCDPSDIQREDKEVAPFIGVYSAWSLFQVCDGPALTYGPSGGQTWQCAGQEVYRRTHQCYQEGVHTTDSTGAALQFTRVEPCGQDAPAQWSDWDKTDAECNSVCLNAGVIRQRYLWDFCKKTNIPCTNANAAECRQQCGRVGNWHQWSTWSTCSNSCGGIVTRSRKHECGVEDDQVETMTCGANDGWGPWTQFDTMCPSSYPEACTDLTTSRSRTSQCGVLNQNGALEYSQVDTVLCAKPTMPAPSLVESTCTRECHDIENGLYGFKTLTWYNACQEIVNKQTAECNLEPCCNWKEWSAWSMASCSGEQKRSRANTCRTILNEEQSKPSATPIQPYNDWSTWSRCDEQCPLSRRYKFRCPVCHTALNIWPTTAAGTYCINDVTGELLNHQAEFEAETCAEVANYKCDPCVGACGEGTKRCYNEDRCTMKPAPGSVTYEFCPLTPPNPSTPIFSTCSTNNNCPGFITKTVPAVIDNGIVCSIEEISQVPCGAPAIPNDTVGSWSTCDASTCIMSRTISNECTGFSRTEVQDCKPYVSRTWTAPSMCKTDNNDPTYYYGGQMLPCSGYREQFLPAMCPGEVEERRVLPCGLEMEFSSMFNLNGQNCLDNVPHYHDCQRDTEGNCIFPQASLSCENKIYTDTISVTRHPICAKWATIQCSKVVSINPKVDCDPCETSTFAWGTYGPCSEDCKRGYQTRAESQICDNFGAPFTKQTGNYQNQACGPEPSEYVEDGVCLNKAGTCQLCSNAGTGTKTRSTYRHVVGRPDCGAELLHQEEIACQLPRCPYWEVTSFPQCGMCDASVSRTRTCETPSGAEACDCLNTPFEDTLLCPSIITWSEWSQFGDCSKECGGGEMSRTRHNLCDMNQIEANTSPCNVDPGSYIYSGETICSSSRCIKGYNNEIYVHTCLKDANGKPIEKTGQPKVCYDPAAIATTTSYGICSSSPGVPQTACEVGIRKVVTRSECVDLSAQYPEFRDIIEYEECTVPEVLATDWSEFTPCTRLCINQDEQPEFQTSTRFNTCAKLETRTAMCDVKPCAHWHPFVVTTRCSCANPGDAVVTRTCVDSTGAPTIGCVGQGQFKLPCGVGTSHTLINSATSVLPLLPESLLHEVKNLDLGWWKVDPGVWTTYGACERTCDVSGNCGNRYRTKEPSCVDSDNSRVSYGTYSEAEPCMGALCDRGAWSIIDETCSSPSITTCSGVRTVSKKHSCTGAVIKEDVGSCGVQGTWSNWSQFTACRTSCSQDHTNYKSRTRSYSCTSEARPDETETVACPSLVCPYFGAWSTWSACTVSCGMGTKRRTRYCHGGTVGQGFCTGADDNLLGDEVVKCDMGDCCEWDWSGWTGCCSDPMATKNKRIRLRGNNCGQDIEQVDKPCENDIVNPSAIYPACSVFSQTAALAVNRGSNMKFWDQAGSTVVPFWNPDKKNANRIFEDFRANEDPITHVVSSEGGIRTINQPFQQIVQQTDNNVATVPDIVAQINAQVVSTQPAAVPLFTDNITQSKPAQPKSPPMSDALNFLFNPNFAHSSN